MRNKVREVIKEVNMLTGINVFEPSRKRQYVEGRSLLIHILYKYYKYRLRDLTELFEIYGYPITHASVIHSLKTFEIYLKYNPDLVEWYQSLVYDIEDDSSTAKIDFIIPKLRYLSDDDLLKLSTIVKEMYEEAIINMREGTVQT